MRFDEHVIIAAPPERVWAVYADVTAWPGWTASISSVELLDGATALAVGVKARVRQPKLPVAVWEVTELVPGRSWTWVARGPGVRTTATHTVLPVADNPGGTRVESLLVQEGPVGAVIARVYAGLTRRYLTMEAEGLKARCEQADDSDAR
jgi:uncharacterized protein YndB with AHSA1/START domain